MPKFELNQDVSDSVAARYELGEVISAEFVQKKDELEAHYGERLAKLKAKIEASVSRAIGQTVPKGALIKPKADKSGWCVEWSDPPTPPPVASTPEPVTEAPKIKLLPQAEEPAAEPELAAVK